MLLVSRRLGGTGTSVPGCFMGAAFVYGWGTLVSQLVDGLQGESVWNVIIPLAMALAWKVFEDKRIRAVVAWICACVGAAAILVLVHGGESPWRAAAFSIYHGVRPAMLLLWCWVYGHIPMARAVCAFGGMQLGAFLLAALALLLPHSTYEGLALAMPFFSSFAFVRAQELVGADALVPAKRGGGRAAKALRWKILLAAFFCACAFGMVNGAFSGTRNAAFFGLSGLILFAAVVLFRHRASTQSLFNVALPALVAGLAVAAIVGIGSRPISGLLTGTGYALMMALFTLILADRAYRFAIPALWSIGIMRATLGLGRWLGDGMAVEMAGLPLYEPLLPLGAVLTVLLASIIWMRDAYSVTKNPMVELDGASALGSAGRQGGVAEEAGAACLVQEGNALREQMLMRCAEVGEEYHLSKREIEVLECLAFGWSVPRIEEKLVISNSTAKTHVRHIYSKMGIHSRDELKVLLAVDVF